jgi:hypothetical protein
LQAISGLEGPKNGNPLGDFIEVISWFYSNIEDLNGKKR